MKALSYKTIHLPKKMKQLAILVLIFSQLPLVVKAMVPGKNLEPAAESTQDQEAAQQNQQHRTLAVQETTTTTTTNPHQERTITTTTTATPHQEERVTGLRRNFEAAFPEENETETQPALTRPRLAEQTEQDVLTTGLSAEEIFSNEDFFLMTVDNIIKNNLTSSEALREAVDRIVNLHRVDEKYTTYLNDLLKYYSHDEQEQEAQEVKVMRYILSRAYPELQEKVILLTTFEEGSDLVKLLVSIDALRNEEIQQGNLLKSETPLGAIYKSLFYNQNCVASKKFFDKVKEAFNNNQRGLQQFLTQPHSSCNKNTPLDAFSQNSNPNVTTIFLNTLEAAFGDDPVVLQEALSDCKLLEIYFYTKVENIAQDPDNLSSGFSLWSATEKILSLSKHQESKSFFDDLLADVCTEEEKDQITLQIKVMRYISGKAYPVLRDDVLSLNSFDQACNLIKLLDDINALTNEQIQKGLSDTRLHKDGIVLRDFYNKVLKSKSNLAEREFEKRARACFCENTEKLQATLDRCKFFIKLESITNDILRNKKDFTHCYLETLTSFGLAKYRFINMLDESVSEMISALREGSLVIEDEKYATHLKNFLRNYSNGEQDQSAENIKIMRYILTKVDPELQEDTLFLNTFGETQDFLESLNTINRLTDEQIRRGNLMDKNTILGQMYEKICQQPTERVTKKFFDKIKRAFDGNLSALKKALTQQNNEKMAPLHYAAGKMNHNVTRALLHMLQLAFTDKQELKKELIKQDATKRTPLDIAAQNNNHEVISAFLGIFDYAFEDKLERLALQVDHSALRHAASNKNFLALKALLTTLQHISKEQMRIILTHQDASGSTALHAATHNHNPEVLMSFFSMLQQVCSEPRQLQEALSKKDKYGYTVLHAASANRNHNVTKAFLHMLQLAFTDKEELKKELIKQDNYKRTPLDIAAQNNNHEVISAFLGIFDYAFEDKLERLALQVDHSALKHAALNKNFLVLKALLSTLQHISKEQIRTMLTHSDDSGSTALHSAASNNNPEVITNFLYILQQVCSEPRQLQEALAKKDKYGYTPLDRATQKNNPMAVHFIQNTINQVEMAINAQ